MRSRPKTILWTLALAMFVAVLMQACSGGEKKLEEQVTR